MPPRHPASQLLLLPAGLIAGHAISYGLLRTPEHTGVLFAGSTEALVCVSVPLAVAAIVRAVIAGLRDEPTPIRFAPQACLQVTLFVLLELLEHAGGAHRPSMMLALAGGIVAQLVAAALLCALVHGATSIGRRTRERRLRPLADSQVPDWVRATRFGWSAHILVCLRRRGPPVSFA